MSRTARFQSFAAVGGPGPVAGRVAAFRQALAKAGLAGFMCPRADEYQSEYVAPHAERLLWLTGFAGSAGLAIVLAESAALFVDGRYVLQAPKETDTAVFEIVRTPPALPQDWVAGRLRPGDALGYDPRLTTMATVRLYAAAVEAAGARLAPHATPIDTLWTDRPAPPAGPAFAHDMAHAGQSAEDKLAGIAAELQAAGHGAAVLATLDSVAWAFNLRGTDTPHTPFVEARGLVTADGAATLFIAPEKLAAPLGTGYTVQPPQALGTALAAVAAGGGIRLDPATTPESLAIAVREAGGTPVDARDPCLVPRACKTAAEIAGSRAAHLRDGVALVRCLAWLADAAPPTDEIAVACRLEMLRAEGGMLRDVSFDTIAGYGPNGAIVHYRPSVATSRVLKPPGLLLLDSGAQYADGTTDVTRTIAIGVPTEAMRRHYTLVLRGHIAIATLRFPAGTRGMDIDAFARAPLWAAGLDYDHGTGHGVGSFASVHEGPQGISRRSTTALDAGMIVSNEPGYYRENAYGIRIENLLLVTPAEPVGDGERAMHGFETLTLCPYDRALILPDLLPAAERAWLDGYNMRVCDALMPLLPPAERTWLLAATAPLD